MKMDVHRYPHPLTDDQWTKTFIFKTKTKIFLKFEKLLFGHYCIVNIFALMNTRHNLRSVFKVLRLDLVIILQHAVEKSGYLVCKLATSLKSSSLKYCSYTFLFWKILKLYSFLKYVCFILFSDNVRRIIFLSLCILVCVYDCLS